MTSKVSFPKLLLETLRRHIAVVLITALLFILHFIVFFLNIQNTIDMQYVVEYYSNRPSETDVSYILEEIKEICSPNLANAVLAMFIGVFLAFDFFRYLHSKRQTDFYESMPVKKEKWFTTLFAGSFCVFAIFCTVTIVLELAVVYGVGYGCAVILQTMLWNLLCMIGVFLACYVTAALAMILTGHSVVAFLGFGVFASYVPLLLANLFPAYAGKFFQTYVSVEGNAASLYFSPVTLAYKTMYAWYDWKIADHWTYLIGCFIFALLIGVIDYFLFLRRPSETAGRAMAFEKVNFIIRFLLVIPLSLYAGLFLDDMSSYASAAWLIFGIIFSAFLIHGIIECIFQFDIKALISKKRQLLLSMVLSLVFVLFFWADVFHYDEYIPAAKNVDTVKISTYMFEPNENIKDEWKDGLTGEYVENALAAVKDIMEVNAGKSSDDRYYYGNSVTVTYQLKNGQQRSRRYFINEEEIPESLNSLYATAAFKDDYCILYHLDKINVSSVRVSNAVENFTLNLSEEEMQNFYDIYLDEFTKMTLHQYYTENSLLELLVEASVDGENHATTYRYCINSTFTNTLAFLKEQGVVTFGESEDIKLTNLELYGGKYADTWPRYISDETCLNALKSYMIPNDFMYHTYGDEYIYCDLRYEYNGDTYYMNIYLKASDLEKVLK